MWGGRNQKFQFQDVDSVMERLDCRSKIYNGMDIFCICACLAMLCSSEHDSKYINRAVKPHFRAYKEKEGHMQTKVR